MSCSKFTFHVAERPFPEINGKEMQERFIKWSMKGRFRVQSFNFDQKFQVYDKQRFMLDFFQDPVVSTSLLRVTSGNDWVPLGITAHRVHVEEIPCSTTSMELFDKLTNSEAVHETGQVRKCPDDVIDGVLIADEVRKMFVSEESEYVDLFSSEEKKEFIYRLFGHLAIGGQWCQFEDLIEPYLDSTKKCYKELIRVSKFPISGGDSAIQVSSVVLKATAYDDSDTAYFPHDPNHIQNFAYFIVDPITRTVITMYHQYGGDFSVI